MATQSVDTHPDAERFFISLFRQLTVSKLGGFGKSPESNIEFE